MQKCFSTCVESEISGEDCKIFIQGVLGHDVSGHEMPLEGINVHSPRTSPPDGSVAASNLLVISTDMDGEVICILDEGVQRFGKFVWVDADGEFIMPDVPCTELDDVQWYVTIRGVMVFWVHQELLEPIIGYGCVSGVVNKTYYFDIIGQI
jgi:hypothetical protein